MITIIIWRARLSFERVPATDEESHPMGTRARPRASVDDYKTTLVQSRAPRSSSRSRAKDSRGREDASPREDIISTTSPSAIRGRKESQTSREEESHNRARQARRKKRRGYSSERGRMKRNQARTSRFSSSGGPSEPPLTDGESILPS